MNNLSPIVLFVYNRPEHTQRVLDALKKNDLSINSKLFIYSDGPKKEEHIESVNQVRKVIRSVSGFLNVEVVERDTNAGLANSIIKGVDEIIRTFGTAIIVEDDLIVSPFFLDYMNQGLKIYENDENAASIHGYVYPVKAELPETFFLRGADCWGWATWKRAWHSFEPDAKLLIKELESKNLVALFDFNGSVRNFKMLKKQASGKIDSWAIRWHASSFLKGLYTLYPGKSLVQNIGNDQTGTHTSATTVYDVNLAKNKIALQKINLKEDPEIRKAMENYFRSIRLNYFQKTVKILKKN